MTKCGQNKQPKCFGHTPNPTRQGCTQIPRKRSEILSKFSETYSRQVQVVLLLHIKESKKKPTKTKQRT